MSRRGAQPQSLPKALQPTIEATGDAADGTPSSPRGHLGYGKGDGQDWCLAPGVGGRAAGALQDDCGVPSSSAARQLGSETDRHLAHLFSLTATATAKDVSRVLGIDPKTLREMTLDGKIGSVPRGKMTAYSESNIRNYLEGQSPCQSTNRKRAASGSSTSDKKVKGFMDRRTQRRSVRLKL